MSHPHSPEKLRTTLLSTAGKWFRRTVLIGSIVVSMAIAGERAVARTGNSIVEARSGAVADVPGPGLALAIQFVGAMYRSGTRLSDGSVEVVSLLVLGLSLIGGGQVLTRKREGRRSTKS